MSLANLNAYLTIPAVPTIPSSLPPSGPAGGDLTGTYPNPTLVAIGSATGPIGDSTHVAAVTIDAKGRVTTLTSVAISGGPPSGAAGGALSGTYPNPGTNAAYAAAFLSMTTTSTVTVGNGTDAADQLVILNAKAGQRDQLSFQTAGLSRWSFFKGSAAESGANAGSNLFITAFDDTGASIDNPLNILRASAGTITLGGTSARPVALTGALSVAGVATLGTASAATGSLVFANASNAFGVTIQSGVTTPGSYTLTLPLAQGGASTFLQNNGSGVLSWAAATAGNLTGPITSVGLATSIASQTGTGTKFVVDTSPTLITPVIGVATGTSLQAIIGNVTAFAGTFAGLTVNDPTTQSKQLTFNLAGATASTLVTILSSQTASRTFTIPATNSNDTFGMLASAQTWTASNTFSNTNGLLASGANGLRASGTPTTVQGISGSVSFYRVNGTLEPIGSAITQADLGQATAVLAGYAGTSPAMVYRFGTSASAIGTIASTYTGCVIAGVQTSLAAVAGQVGEVIDGTNQTTYTNFTATATAQTMASIALTPGDWLVRAMVTFSANSSVLTGGTSAQFGVSSTTNAFTGSTPLNTEGKSIAYVPAGLLTGIAAFESEIVEIPYQVSAATTIYWVGQATFTVGNPQYVASMSARRMR